MKRADVAAKCLAVLAIALGVSVLAARFHVGDNPFLAFGFAGAFALHLAMRQPVRDYVATLLVAGGAGLCYVWGHLPLGTFFAGRLVAALAFLGEGSLIVLIARLLWMDDRDHQRSVLAALKVAVALITYPMVTTGFLALGAALRKNTYDLYLWAFDQTLGIPASSVLGHLFWSNQLIQNSGMLVYEALPLALALLYPAQLRARRGTGVNLLALFLWTGVAGWVLYQLYPACGPLYLFGNAFPERLPAASGLAIHPVALAPAPRNAIPSLHAAWALLLWWNSRGLARWLQAVAGFVLVMTLLVTVGSGEHYVADLIVAVPFSLAMQAACTRSVPWRTSSRLYALTAGAALTLLWLASLRYAIPVFQHAPPLAWGLTAATLLISTVLACRLRRETIAPKTEPGLSELAAREAVTTALCATPAQGK